MTNQEKIALYSSIFRGRTDVYPLRWEKNGKRGWTPAYLFDWNEFNAHRAKGGTIKDFENKTLSPVTSEILLTHLIGKKTIGIYPILQDNSRSAFFRLNYLFLSVIQQTVTRRWPKQFAMIPPETNKSRK